MRSQAPDSGDFARAEHQVAATGYAQSLRTLELPSLKPRCFEPSLSGLMDGALSTLAPIFAVVLATHRPLTAFYTGIATALGAEAS
jgi:hypothetical protein